MYEKLNQDCDGGHFVVTQEECRDAALSLVGALRDDALVVGTNWNHVPYGCTIQKNSDDIHFNTKSDPSAASFDGFRPVCKRVSLYKKSNGNVSVTC